MSFEYNEYYKVLFAGALGLMLFSIVAFTIYAIKYFKHTQLKTERFFLVLAMVLCVAFFTGGAVPFFTHGIYLSSEKETASVTSCGEITRYYEAYGLNKYVYDGKNCFAHYVIIDNERYYIIDIGDFKVGDSVSFEYLPKSKIILSIKKCN